MFYSTFSKYWNLGKKEACKFASLFKNKILKPYSITSFSVKEFSFEVTFTT